MPNTTKDVAGNLRVALKTIAQEVLNLKDISKISDIPDNGNYQEVTANIMLAYRHIEDASMRLGKVMQHADGGISVYDKEQTVAA